jgi:hypothetical protein
VPPRPRGGAGVIVRAGRPNVNFAIYGRAFGYLARNPSIAVIPLLAALVDTLVSYWGSVFTDPTGGSFDGLISMAVQILYLFAFGATIVHANNIVRGTRRGFEASWNETRGKIGGILLAAVGFQFVTWAAAYVGSFLGIGLLGLALQLAAYFFLILTMPAAAIGGLPGGLALSGSMRAVRANWPACVVLAIAFVGLWIYVPSTISTTLFLHYGMLASSLGLALARAIVLAYLTFPFAVTYDETAFRGFY